MRTSRSTSRGVQILLTLLLLAVVGSWAHSAVHVGDAHGDGGCLTCQWVKHSPGRPAPAARPLTVAIVVALLVALAPVAPGGTAVSAPTGRAPPRRA